MIAEDGTEKREVLAVVTAHPDAVRPPRDEILAALGHDADDLLKRHEAKAPRRPRPYLTYTSSGPPGQKVNERQPGEL